MASSSSARWSYDVFLSFRGEDTRKTFTSHLYEVLNDRGIKTFQDDKRLEYGATISEELCKAIEESQFSIVIFSKNYTTSRWCMNELVKIMECKTQFGQIVIPIFYDVDPSHVRNQKESFAKAFEEHVTKYKDDVEGIQRWRIALTAAANLKGSCDNRDKTDAECIRHIVGQISSKLCKISLSYLQNIVGIDTHLEKIESLLEIGINDVRIMGMWGMGGVGKTTIARAMFDTLLGRRDSSYQFDGACFLKDIKENKHRMHSLQNILLSNLLREKANYKNEEDGKHQMASRLRSKKVLIVLDDIDDKDHYLEYLAGDLDWFGNGSRIIVTTRDKHLIGKNDVIYEVTALPDHESIQLFYQHAFKKEDPDECFKELSLEVVNYTKGLPLALGVLGSSLYNRDITVWKSAIEQMKNNPNSKIVEKLKISYDGLESTQQEIFLDIACFFRGKKKDDIMQVLKSCHFGAEYGLDVLIEKSLVFITEDGEIEMHDLIQEMGRYIVNLQKDLGKCSRLWLAKDFEEVMINNTGTMAMEAIFLPYFDFDTLRFSKKAMENMKRLRIFNIGRSLAHDGFIEYLSNSLRWFVWYYYPFESLPSTFEPKMLVHLQLVCSSLHHLWTETKHLLSLRRINLSSSKSLMRTPDFTGIPNLEYLNLHGCTSLEEVHHSLGRCRKLIQLDLYYCKSLKRFPCVNVESLEYLCLENCSSLEKFPESHGRMKPEIQIDMEGCRISELPSSITQYQTHITKLNLSGMEKLVALPSSISRLKSLVSLSVSDCSKLESLPEEIGDLDNLEELDARDTLISRPPSTIVRLNKLKILDFRKLNSISEHAISEPSIMLRNGVHFEFPPVAEGLRSLEILDLGYCNLIDGGLPEDIGSLSSLKELNLHGNNFEHLPRSIAQLGALRSLDLSYCQRLTQLPELPPELDTIYVDWSNDFICNLLFQNISSLQHDISASDSLSLRVFTSMHYICVLIEVKIPSWFHHQGTDSSVSVNLPENWYIPHKFLGFALCYSCRLVDATAQLILCDDGMSWKTRKLALSNHSELGCFCGDYDIHLFFVPFAGLWDTSKANGKTPNDYGIIRLSFSGKVKKYGLRLLYKEEPEVEALLQMRENNNEPTEHSIGIRRSRSDNSEHHDSVTDGASCCRIL
uniref:ADP-ribosyl cyclase/cyclic ADP-ribose hydrolase n=2 Tax=Nicotiana TaxID=4085 RepID=A0A1S3ZRX1_TOBAC|nr:PREDICTED: TMV resistance protein N-like [Nicotiana tabacum]XP_016467105.1 PREDICTED: TMV resistance protein N-like [Nicotiana tabacum]XP_016467106.1 PREDICTED: TMV resistance protein N-like [Nicotiana tabacum]XP_016467107.1 PREDICTED: TMV resistance protein N-like [Nicotiana tabacum]